MRDELPNQDELELLFVNNESMSHLGSHLNRFNPIRIMRMESMEIRHSAVLGWLLDPRESHGLGDGFLRAFLSEAMRGQSLRDGPTALQIAQSDLRDAEVRRERENIDLLILLPRLKWAFIIENKYFSSQSKGQLVRYMDRVRSTFKTEEKGLIVRGIFLTLREEEPHDRRYAVIRYSNVGTLLQRIISDNSDTLQDEVTIFLKHYLEVIMEQSGMSDKRNEMEGLARQLYRSHRKVIDFIVKYGATTDFASALEAVFASDAADGQSFKVDRHNSSQASFLPMGWIDALGGGDISWAGCENWWAGYPLICWLQLFEAEDARSGRLRLFAEVGPIQDHKLRESLISRIKRVAEEDGLTQISFHKGATEVGKRFSRFLKANSLVVDDVHNAEDIEKAARNLIDDFTPAISSIRKILPDFTTEYSNTIS